MSTIPAKVQDRMVAGLKKIQPIIISAHNRDVNEADTVVIVMEVLCEIFGFDKFNEITREQAIRGTYVDLAIKIGGRTQLLIEVKAIGLELKDMHLRQTIDYAAKEGVEWAVLTNGAVWQIYHITFGKPIDWEKIAEFNLLEISVKKQADLATLFLLSREGMTKSVLEEHHTQAQATNKYILAAIALSDPILDVMRRELRRLTPGVKVEPEEIRQVLREEVFKREVVEGDKAEAAQKKVRVSGDKPLRVVTKKPKATEGEPEPEPEPAPAENPEPVEQPEQSIDSDPTSTEQ